MFFKRRGKQLLDRFAARGIDRQVTGLSSGRLDRTDTLFASRFATTGHHDACARAGNRIAETATQHTGATDDDGDV